MSCNVAPGPVLAEEEMLHDGEPVFALAWGGGTDRSDPAERTPVGPKHTELSNRRPCACGAPARPRTGKRGPAPMRCEPCEREYQRAMNRRDSADRHQGAARTLTCAGCGEGFVSRAARGPRPRRCPECAHRLAGASDPPGDDHGNRRRFGDETQIQFLARAHEGPQKVPADQSGNRPGSADETLTAFSRAHARGRE